MMSRVMAWRSDEDGKLFESKTKYRKHLRKLAAERIQKKAHARYLREKDDFLILMGQQVGIKGLEKFIKINWDRFYQNALDTKVWNRDSRGKHKLIALSLQVGEMGQISNTHAAPRGKQTNWGGRDPSLPRTYLGWNGTIKLTVETPGYKYCGKDAFEDGFGGDYFAGTLINTGSGGGGAGRHPGEHGYSYDLTLWADDFPKWKEIIEKQKVWKAIGGKKENFIDDIELIGEEI